MKSFKDALRARWAAAIAAVVFSMMGLGTSEAIATVPTPTVSIPPAGNHGFPFLTSAINLANFGYTQSEFLISGTAHAYVNSGTLGTNGVWAVTPGAATTYTTRILVRTPSKASFNGTVVVEWLNVTGGIDAEPEWDYHHVELLRAGYAWVGVSAQYVGAEFLPTWDPVRYASIFHPGDSWSYDIYSQAVMAILHGSPQPLGSLTPYVHTVLADGDSQSAFRLFTYYNAIEPVTNIYQGFLIHSTGFGAPLSQSYAGGLPPNTVPAPSGVPATPDITVPATAFIRSGLAQPVLFVNTETDITVLGAGFSVHDQPDSNTFRMWEMAGTTHADDYLLEWAGADAAASDLTAPPLSCGNPPLNNGPETFIMRAALPALTTWVQFPTITPPIAPRFSVQIITTTSPPEALVNRSTATGNAIGGIQLPQLSVPIETLTGIRPAAAVAANPDCELFGAASPWDGDVDPWDGTDLDPAPYPAPSLAKLYGTDANYLAQFSAAIAQSIVQGFLLPADSAEEYGLAQQANVPAGSASNAAIIPNP
jgi:hypothetical protein